MAVKNRTGATSMKSSNGKRLTLGIANALVIIGLGVFGAFYFVKYNDLKNNPPAPELAAQAEVDRYKNEIGELYDLPKDEEPSVATVRDREQLGDQPFFDQAQNGDITLIYSNAKLAILYRPSTKKLINVSTLTITDSPKINVIGASGARGDVVAKLANEQITATEGGDSKTNPTKTIVVDITGKNEATIKNLATLVDGEVGQLPKGETAPEDADIVIIVASQPNETTEE